MDQRDIIRSKAKELGFPFCGFARVDGLGEHRDFYTGFMSRKDYPGMNYLVTTFEKRMEPRKILPEAKTVIGLLQNYYPGETLPEKDRFIVARYAYGKNYRDVIKKKLKELAVSLLTLDPGMKIRYFVDSGPMMEKVWAQKCGLGWQGKNTLLINPKAGSFYFIAILLTSLELEPDKPETDHCGNCDLCVRACPTGALNKPYRLDIPRCIAYLNIVLKTGIPE
jgi:epoxyqueuosine reductase